MASKRDSGQPAANTRRERAELLLKLRKVRNAMRAAGALRLTHRGKHVP